MTDLIQQVVADLEKLPEERQKELAISFLEKIHSDLQYIEERQDWIRLACDRLSAAYGDDEPEYTEADIIRE